MKWKRSKKAQQESKVKDVDSLNSDKRQSSSHNIQVQSSPNLKASVSQPEISNSPQIQIEQSQSPRKLSENEALYRPYVV